MNVEILKKVIISQKEEIEEKFKKSKIIEREPEKNRLKKFLFHPNILAILGVRRCGKSIFSWQIFSSLSDKAFAYINFDDERLADIKTEDLDKILQAFYELYGKIERMILDEPQNVEKWELFVNRLRRTKSLIITGSNSKLLSGELSTHLTGRYIDFNLFPFSFREFLDYKGFKIEKDTFYSVSEIAQIKSFLEEYIKTGGFPEVYILGREILSRIYADIIEKDILKRYKIKRKETFKRVARYLISNISSEFTMRKLSHIFEIKDVHTLKNWLGALEDSYLLFVLERYSPKLKQQEIAPKKIYCIDTAMADVISFKISENIGKLMENLVAGELLRRKSYWQNNWEIYYYKDHQQREIDFLIKEGSEIKNLIQVSFINTIEEMEEKEIDFFKKASSLLKCKNLSIITWDYEEELNINEIKIKFIPLWKWLLT
ncbi:MAG: hypothetical protein DRP76_03220 [Candidatus Omnitrophota bacterium]|nr:MAG: hypothetical protein DRP76_03220 [Candidatus Omnitrophota bacterium]